MFGIVTIKFFGTINGIPEQDFREAKEMSAIWRMIEGKRVATCQFVCAW
jgi:hypothetical protein